MMVLVVGLLASGCALTPEPTVFTAPKEEQSAQPTIKKANLGVENVAKKNRQIGKQVDKQENVTAEQKAEIAEAIFLVQEMRRKLEEGKKVSAEEVASLILVLDKIRSRNLFLEASLHNLKNSVNIQAKDLMGVETHLQEAGELTIKKENETSNLRAQNENYIKESAKWAKIAKENVRLTKKAASSGVYKLWFFLSIAIIVLLIAGIVWIKAVNPLPIKLGIKWKK